jgi:hypothetical protein
MQLTGHSDGVACGKTLTDGAVDPDHRFRQRPG